MCYYSLLLLFFGSGILNNSHIFTNIMKLLFFKHDVAMSSCVKSLSCIIYLKLRNIWEKSSSKFVVYYQITMVTRIKFVTINSLTCVIERELSGSVLKHIPWELDVKKKQQQRYWKVSKHHVLSLFI